MSVSTISLPTVSIPQSSHPAHKSHAKGGSGSSPSSTATSAADAKANESLEQLAADGDPTAIAELKAEQLKPQPATQTTEHAATQTHTGATEPGKGEEVDVYV
jgi:hypothetical protein